MNAPAPKVSFVSLGCPKALVDSERIITQLRAEGYELTKRTTGPTSSSSTPAASSTAPRRSRSMPSARPWPRTARSSSPAAWARSPSQIRDTLPERAGDHRAAGIRERRRRRCIRRRRPAHDPFLDLVPPQGVKLTPRHYAYLKISEGCNNRCSFCIIPKLRGDLVSRPARRRAARGREAGEGRRQGDPGHFAGHQRLRRRPEVPGEPVAGSRGAHALLRPRARSSASSARGCACTTSIPTRMSTRSSPSWRKARSCPISTSPSSTPPLVS